MKKRSHISSLIYDSFVCLFHVRNHNTRPTKCQALFLYILIHFFTYSMYMMLRSKDALRIVPYFVLTQSCPIFAYREACASLLCEYWGGPQGLSPTYEQAHVDLDLLTLASYKIEYIRCVSFSWHASFFMNKRML